MLHVVGCLHYYIPFTLNLLVHNFKLYHCRQISLEISNDHLSIAQKTSGNPQTLRGRKPTVNSKSLARFQTSAAKQLRTFRDNLSVPSWTLVPRRRDPMGCPETSVRNCHCSPRNNPKTAQFSGKSLVLSHKNITTSDYYINRSNITN